jgi:hypothetical protein
MDAIKGMSHFRMLLAEQGIEFTLDGLDTIGELALMLMDTMGVGAIQICDPSQDWGFQFSASDSDEDGYDYIFVEFE